MEEKEEIIVVDEVLDLKGVPHTICEISRESLSTVPEKSEKELYIQENPSEEENEEL